MNLAFTDRLQQGPCIPLSALLLLLLSMIAICRKDAEGLEIPEIGTLTANESRRGLVL
jgi:hypothetical protein